MDPISQPPDDFSLIASGLSSCPVTDLCQCLWQHRVQFHWLELHAPCMGWVVLSPSFATMHIAIRPSPLAWQAAALSSELSVLNTEDLLPFGVPAAPCTAFPDIFLVLFQYVDL